MHDEYATGEESGDGWTLRLGDSCEELARVADNSVDLSVYSPPFASLFTYSPSPRDLGNCRNEQEFAEHYRFVIREMLRVTTPGRVSAVHVTDLGRTKATHGYMGLHDLPGDVIRAHTDEGWIYFGRTTVDKDPQAQAIRTKSHALMFVTKNRDSAGSRPALADYLLLFKKPGENAVPVDTDVTNDEWIQWARPIWASDPASRDDGLVFPPSSWSGIKETDTLNAKVAREDADERHICPLQMGFIERCVRLWSNPGELVLTPFAGIGSEVYGAVKHGRRGIGIELKASYWATAVTNLRRLEAEMATPTLLSAGGPAA